MGHNAYWHVEIFQILQAREHFGNVASLLWQVSNMSRVFRDKFVSIFMRVWSADCRDQIPADAWSNLHTARCHCIHGFAACPGPVPAGSPVMLNLTQRAPQTSSSFTWGPSGPPAVSAPVQASNALHTHNSLSLPSPLSVWHQSWHCSTILVRTRPALRRHPASVQRSRQFRRFTYSASCN